MSIETTRDPREALVRDKYFSLHPKPLERWLWQQGLPQAAERVFWLHWEEGMKRGDWCSELSLRQVARECCVDPSTVTRAYQVLRARGLIRREDPGRDPANPFQQATAITEVRLPRDLITELSRAPNRPQRNAAPTESRQERRSVAVAIAGDSAHGAAPESTAEPKAAMPRLSRAESAALMDKLSAHERAEFFVASRDRRTAMRFDEATALNAEERGAVLEILAQISGATPRVVQRAAPAAAPVVTTLKPRQVSALEAARLRRQILAVIPASAAREVLRQILWSVEEGALRRFDVPLAVNIALKKLREGLWTRPNRMPPQWLRAGAAAGTCSAA